MVGPRSHKKVATIRALLMKTPGKKADQPEKATQQVPSSAMGDATRTTHEAEPVTRTFLETLFGALCVDIATLKQDLTKDIKGLTRDMNELGVRVDSLERTSGKQGDKLDAHRCKILDLHDKSEKLQYQVEDVENRSRRANITINVVPLQAAGGNLEDHAPRLFHHNVPELPPQEIIVDRIHRAGIPATSPGQPHNILTCLRYYRQKENIMAAARDPNHIDFEGNTIWQYQDLLPITLQQCHQL
ncbi:hypothetical protein NDU88_000163 [Pleurodeles waltl]|uniref:Uncharacterized protein n=1 Tax=Pleurodeles waltl TaxID=8319 RepID=A0AAV7WEN1_PLEWA|nr:hypothetical protein NDU88_000163 [Pleurodeles waltl]